MFNTAQKQHLNESDKVMNLSWILSPKVQEDYFYLKMSKIIASKPNLIWNFEEKKYSNISMEVGAFQKHIP